MHLVGCFRVGAKPEQGRHRPVKTAKARAKPALKSIVKRGASAALQKPHVSAEEEGWEEF
jgi:hypothetical protein